MAGKQPKRKQRPGVDEYGRTPLHHAACDGDLARAQLLLTDGATPGPADDNGWTPLHFAARDWHVDVARILLDAGADIDSRDSHGNTPLFHAVFNSNGRGDLIALLRERGADPLLQNLHGVSPVGLARTIANFDIAQYFTDLPWS